MELCHSASTYPINIARHILCRKQDDTPESELVDQRSQSRTGCDPNAPAICPVGTTHVSCIFRKRELQCASGEVREPKLAWTEYAAVVRVVEVHRLGKLAGR